MENNVLITGVAGFIGSNLAKKFLKEGYKVIGIDNLSSGKIENIPKKVEFINGDLCDKNIFNQIKLYCPYILHLAGQSSGEISFEDPVDDIRKNTISTLNLIKFGINNGSQKIVYASSMSVYGKSQNKLANENDKLSPLSCYGISKLSSEKYLDLFSTQLPYVSLRMFNVYGPGQDLNNLKQGMVSIYLSQALKTKNICVKGSLERYRDYIFIDDTVEAWYKVTLSDNIYNTAINIGTGEKTSVKSLLEIIKSKIANTDYYVTGSTPGDQHGIVADNYKLKGIMKISEFTKIETGIEKYLSTLKINIQN